MLGQELSEREKNILRYVIHQFILTASPVGSRNIAKRYEIGVSPATVRNIMADLEEFGFLDHPHTSAGRVPTDKGYRFYVDSLMGTSELSEDEKQLIRNNLPENNIEADELLKLTTIILSNLTHQLACVTYPNIDDVALEKIQIVSISSSRLLVVLSLSEGMVKTITLEVDSTATPDQLIKVEQLLNEKLGGLTFSEIRTSFSERIKDSVREEQSSIIRVFIDSADKIFTDIKLNDKIIISGAKNIVKQPEFEDLKGFESVIELIEDKDVIIHFLDKNVQDAKDSLSILIGLEDETKKLSDYSLVTKSYELGSTNGKVGIIGPKRMEYPKIAAAVSYVAELLSMELRKTI